MSHDLSSLLDGFRNYRDNVVAEDPDRFRALCEGQNPTTAIVACSDSRVDPAILFQAEPGEIFMIRNVANLVPPMEREGKYHGTSAALEFAVIHLGVSNIVILGHAHCGGIAAMMQADSLEDDKPPADGFHYIQPWVSMLAAAHRRVLALMPDADEKARARACERNAVLVSLENLTTFPCIRERVVDGKLKLHGWYYDIGQGSLEVFDSQVGRFEAII